MPFGFPVHQVPGTENPNQRFHDSGMQVVANIKPCLLDDHPAYAQVAAQGGFNHDTQGHPVLEACWDGIGAHLDFTKNQTIACWQQQLRLRVLDYGIDIGWNDNDEYAILDDDARCTGFGSPMPMHRCSAPAAPARQASSATRKPGAVTTPPSWETLRWNIRTGLQMPLSGVFNIGHDVGGFAGSVPEPELFLR